jgi:hypothetical protein
MSSSGLIWIDEGRRFLPDDIVFWQGKGTTPFCERAAAIDTIVFGPHASFAFPAELKPFISTELTRRTQCDFSDMTTSPLGRAWAEADPHVVFIENPHARLVMDANRKPVEDIGLGLRIFFERLRARAKGEKISFTGVDAVRPITFSDEPVLLEPHDPDIWNALVDALQRAADLGPRSYMRIRDGVVEEVLAAKKPGEGLLLISLHDTMNTQMTPRGAISRERPPADRLPALVNFGNLGDELGNGEAVSFPGSLLRRLGRAWADAWGLKGNKAKAISLNAPYKGAFETQYWGCRLRGLRRPGTGIVQAEFPREFLLGNDAAERLRRPGVDWPATDAGHIAGIVRRLLDAGERFRSR